MSSAPSWMTTRRAGCSGQRRPRRSRSPRLRACCGGTGHCPSRDVLSAGSATAPLMASWSPTRWQLVGRTVMVEPEVAGHQAGVGRRRGPLGDRGRPAARSAASDRGWPARGRRAPSHRARPSASTTAGAGCVGVRARGSPGRCPTVTSATSRAATTIQTRTLWRAAALQVCSLPIHQPHERRRRAAAEVRPYRLGLGRGQQDEAAVVAAEAERVGEDGTSAPMAAGAPCTIGIVISGSGSS